MKKNPRLLFTQEERANPLLKKPIQKAEQAAVQAEQTQAKIPSKVKKERVFDPATGKVKTQLHFEEKKPPSKLAHVVQAAPGQVLSSAAHRRLREYEKDTDNVSAEATHASETAIESTGHIAASAYRVYQSKPFREQARAEKKLEKANIRFLQKRAEQTEPSNAGGSVSHWRQKQQIKRQYIKERRSGAFSKTTRGPASTAAKKHGKRFVQHHKTVIALILALLLSAMLIVSTFASCSVLLDGGLSIIAGSTYPSKDEDMLGAEAAYSEMEAELQAYLDQYEATHDYDQYVFELDEIGHDPYVLISLVTAYFGGGWTLEEAQDTLAELFSQQYILTETVSREWRPDEDGEAYYITVCTVKLENRDLSQLTTSFLNEDQLSQYAVYMAVLGNRPDLFPNSEYPNASQGGNYTDYDIPPEALEDATFAAMIKEAEKYLGYPYVWGGSSPSTSFDCSGFVSWVINHSGWSVGRQTARSLLSMCTRVSPADARPGDLIFFQGTYNVVGASHVGIYVGNNKMIHCGNPISYASIDTKYWRSHFLSFGRLP